MEWNSTSNIIYFISKKFIYSPNVSIFNFIDTLVKVNKDGIKFFYKNIPEKFYNLYKNNASIVIYQSISENNINYIQEKFLLFIDKLNYEINNTYNNKIENNNKSIKLPIMVFFSIKNNSFAKPCTGVWKMINLLYKKKKKLINSNKCIMVGNLAGRIKENNIKKDINVSDRAFAFNINIKFSTPEGFFKNNEIKHISKWRWDEKFLSNNEKKYLIEQKSNISSPNIINNIMKLDNLCKIIFITGMPSSGKSAICKNLQKKIYETNNKIICKILDENTNIIIKKIEFILNNHLNDKKSTELILLIDITFNYIEFINILKILIKFKLQTLIIETSINDKFNKLLNFINVENNNIYIIKPYEWKKYNSEINKIPKLINNLKFIKYIKLPILPNISKEFWYEYSY